MADCTCDPEGCPFPFDFPQGERTVCSGTRAILEAGNAPSWIAASAAMTKSLAYERRGTGRNAWTTLPMTKALAVIAAKAAIQETQAGECTGLT